MYQDTLGVFSKYDRAIGSSSPVGCNVRATLVHAIFTCEQLALEPRKPHTRGTTFHPLTGTMVQNYLSKQT
jgi:hypothetical protein